MVSLSATLRGERECDVNYWGEETDIICFDKGHMGCYIHDNLRSIWSLYAVIKGLLW